MGFLFGFLMFVCSYLMVGPILIGAYVLQHSKDRQQIEEKTKALLICIALYVVVWVIALCVKTILNHIVWVVVGAIIGAICSYVTYDKNKKQAVVNSDTHKSFVSSSPQGTDELFDAILFHINLNGINYIDEESGMPYLALIIYRFNKTKVEKVINAYHPNLNIRFYCDDVEVGLLEIAAESEKDETFKLLIDKGVRCKNYNQVLLSLINTHNYNSLKYLVDHTKVDFNIPISSHNLSVMPDLFAGQTILDYALANNAHEYIIDLIKQNGGKRSCDIKFINNEDEIVIEQNVDNDLNRKAFNEFVKEVKSSLVKDVVNSIEEINTRIANVWKGNEDVFSKAEIVQFALNLKSFKEKLSKEMYDKVIELYNVYQGKEYCIYQKYNLLAMQYEIKMIQDEFSQLIDREIASSGDVI